MDKKKILLTIGEVARSIGITRRIILNYEDRGLVRPDVKDGETANRYYTLDTLTRIRSIRAFQNMGLTLDEIRDYFDDSSDLTPILTRLESLRDEINLNIEKIRERMNPGGEAEISFVVIPRQTVYRRILRSPTIAERIMTMRDIGMDAIQQYGTDITRRMYFIEFPLSDPDLISYCIAIPEGSIGESVTEMEECPALCVYYHGDYTELPSVREALLDAAEERGLSTLGVCRHIYLEGPPQHKDPKHFITQVALPVADRRKNLSPK